MIFILGASGDVGTVVKRRLSDNRKKFTAPTSQELDLRDGSQCREYFNAIDEPYSLIFGAFIDRRRANDETALVENIQITSNVTKYARPTSTIFLSSIDVYGACPALPIYEGTATVNHTQYSLAKLLAEKTILYEWSSEHPVTILRLPGIFGGQGARNSALDRMLKQGIATGSLVIDSGGSRLLRDWVWAEDLATLLIHLSYKPVGGLFNVATGLSWPIWDYASECTKSLLGVRLFDEGSVSDASPTGIDHRFDVSKFQETFPMFRFTERSRALALYVKEIELYLSRDSRQ